VAEHRSRCSWDHPIILTFLIIAVVAAMALAAEVLKPLALAILLSFALAPWARFWERCGLPRSLAVLVTVVLALSLLAGIGLVVGRELTVLASRLPTYERNIGEHLKSLRAHGATVMKKATAVADQVSKELIEDPLQPESTRPVRVVSIPTFQERLQGAVGPYLEYLGVGTFVLILVSFILINRENLGDRLIRLFGTRRIPLTTRTMEEVGSRISRYLATLAVFNSGFGVVVGLGLWAIGVPFAVLWGFLAAVLRFIPYVGPATAFALSLLFTFAQFPTWREPLEVLALFAVLEVLCNSFLEPVLYGKTTGVSALGLLVAAMFWTWLWGLLGLLLSTPLTVCLAVLGRAVPSLGFFWTLLGEEAELARDVRFYQRLLVFDEDGARDVLDAALKQQPRIEVFDQVVVPALARAERDAARGELDEREQAFLVRTTSDWLDELEEAPVLDLKTLAQGQQDGQATSPATPLPLRVLGLASGRPTDALVLRMLSQVAAPSGITIETLSDAASPLAVAEEIASREADVLVISHLAAASLSSARYLVRRLRAQFASMPILVGRWNEPRDHNETTRQLTEAGASQAAFSLAEARDRLLKLAAVRHGVPTESLLTLSHPA
jgi:predicted PurR-regulated permease PerM/methylmalonyl-CoA mutase cobalamin-binding subunit